MARILILWNQTDEDVYEHYRRDDRRAPEWDASLEVEPWETVEEEMQLLVTALESGGHTAKLVNVRDNFANMMSAIAEEKPDAIMNLVEFFRDDPEQEHHVPAVFELLGISYTGNRPLALSMCQKKPQAKALLAAAGVPVPRGIIVDANHPVPQEVGLRFPLIVKPAYDDASGGIDSGSVVHDRTALENRVAQLLRENRMTALVEEYIDGREIHCAILGDQPLPLYEMEFKGGVDDHGRELPRIITYRAKWDPYSRDHHAVEGKCPVEDLEPEIVQKIQSVAMDAYRALSCRDYARVDMRVDTNTGDVFVLEVNPNPDLADSCAFAASARASGRSYDKLICEIAELAVARVSQQVQAHTGFDLLLREYQNKKKQQKS
ncbi:MAG: D-alanine--D-alanine ligase [Myxococcota bacterium]|nr:D-alanine--D-alanine ligase [Deltaproteobacteria bacterium]MDQ3333538.1 D-alanine--D-alanine ligase [Myxococcota bacterium]